MTIERQRDNPVTAASGPALPDRVLVAVIAGATKIGVVLDATAAVSVQLTALVDLVNTRLAELGESPLAATARGRWTLCWVDGSPLKPGLSLAAQGVSDGTRLWLRFAPDTEARINVVEHVTSAVATELSKRWPAVTPVWAARVGAAMVVAGVLAATVLLARWRYGHLGWLPAAYGGALAAVLLAAAVIILTRRGTSVLVRGLGDTLLLTGCVPAAVAAAAAVPGPVGAPHAALGLATVLVAALLVVRFTGRHIALGTAVIVTAAAGAVIGLVRMTLVTSAPILLTVLLLMAVIGMHVSPTVARWAAGIRLPVFPSASGRWIFEARPDLPADHAVASGQVATFAGPESVREVAVATDRAHSYLSGLLVATTGLAAACSVGLCDPHVPRRWLPLVLAGLVAVAVLLRGRSFTDRWQATILALAAVALVIGVAGRYVLGLWTMPALLVGVSVMVAVPVAGLVAGVVVPNRFYTPTFRKVVEWIEYVCLTGIFPLAFWLMGVLAAIRYR
ncbi:type VII secretion integral membrane protein EccD (plasmid) [Mycobacterium europaeum]|uniref:Secretion protein Snm4 n=1 Tax=Mycobacterium intracellulare subsp. chimaera TaxID=222805 RepID=A0A7U5MR38_MYCIT|nr:MULTISPECIES: type VII secretion integral membrane protein EccD [Mycobacterium]ASL12268.1 secretion protein Snm4 [Mycobacterium intracellulare subsp. chimaera]ASL18139.1 secretion protein Snm4 [Mycobacterium intracellulare subsp. chimaera]MCV7116530.1 type VII secretion integral membrane protein EccD [Mycobacterium nebraskense]MCV7328347.1 type VII secretion integral membrane protein EccD [Mycobacterium intracellulare subsp. chimaera]MEA1162584.1 type VII secretion integral membrane protein